MLLIFFRLSQLRLRIFDRAKKFKDERDFVDENVKVYGSYDDLLNDPNIGRIFFG